MVDDARILRRCVAVSGYLVYKSVISASFIDLSAPFISDCIHVYDENGQYIYIHLYRYKEQGLHDSLTQIYMCICKCKDGYAYRYM